MRYQLLAWALLISTAIAIALNACWSHTPGDPFELSLPEELTTICHVQDRGDGFAAYLTQQYNRSRAEWHLHHHPWDTMGACNQ